MPRTHLTLAKLSAAARAFVAMARCPESVENAYALDQALLALASPARLARQVATFRTSPSLAALLDGRYAPPPTALGALAGCAPGTLGHAYHGFMTDNGLSQGFFPTRRIESDIDLLRHRSLATHDIWHVLMGVPPTYLGEIAFIGFTVAHLWRSVARDRVVTTLYVVLVALAFLLHTAARRTALLPRALASLARGARGGWAARPLWAGRWEAMWDRPLAEIRAAYALRPVSEPMA